MADTYGVAPADIAAELPGLFPGGFGVSTVPTAAQVVSFISAVDLAVTIAIENAAGAVPSAADRLAPLAKRVIIDRVKGQVMRIVYAGLAPADINAGAQPYEDAARLALESITSLTTQATGIGDPPNRVISSNTTPSRALLVEDRDLDQRLFVRGAF